MLRQANLAALGFGLLVLAGCGESVPELELPEAVPVSGTVTLNKKPLVNAMVNFTPEGKGMGAGATGVTDADGKFELVTRNGDETKPGAIPGNYKVWFSQLIGPDGKPIAADSDTPPADLAAKENLPPRYSDPLQSEEKATVGPEGGTFEFELRSR